MLLIQLIIRQLILYLCLLTSIVYTIRLNLFRYLLILITLTLLRLVDLLRRLLNTYTNLGILNLLHTYTQSSSKYLKLFSNKNSANLRVVILLSFLRELQKLHLPDSLYQTLRNQLVTLQKRKLTNTRELSLYPVPVKQDLRDLYPKKQHPRVLKPYNVY